MSATRPAIEFSIGIMPSSALPVLHGGERVLEGGAGQRLPVRIDVAAGDVGVGAGLALDRRCLVACRHDEPEPFQ